MNGRDRTGEAASVSTSGIIIGIRPDGSRYRINRGTDPVDALRILESDSDLGYDDQESLLKRAGIHIPHDSKCRPGESCIGSAPANPNAYTHLPSDGKWVQAAFVATKGLPAQTRAQEIATGVAQTASVVAVAAGVGTKYAMNRAAANAAPDDTTVNVDTALIRYSQTSADAGGRTESLTESMKRNGWKGAAIDVVMTGSLVTLDNTRPTVALSLVMNDIPAIVHMPDEPLPPEM